jgi:diguanylate cyclase (GGDEF)-like protein
MHSFPELSQKSQALTADWRRYQAAPSFENFVELAVSINSFTEFLIDKGFTALHHASHELEQVALVLFNEEVLHPIPQAAADDLNERILGLARMIENYMSASENLSERRAESQPSLVQDTHQTRCIYLIGHDSGAWKDLLTQLGYFGKTVKFLAWNDPLPANIGSDPLLLLDIGRLAEGDWQARIKALRQQFAVGQLICLAAHSDFDQLQQALRSGCDWCLPDGTPIHAIVAQILELDDRQDQEAFRVLIVEDSMTASVFIQRTLQESQISTHAIHDPRQVISALKQYNPDLILMDMYMPNCTGVEAARVIRQHNEFLSIPIVYLSGETNIALQVDAMRLGGDHFLTKPFNPIFLNAIIKSKIERYRALRRSMYRDSLTGLLNHTSGKNTLDTILSSVAHERGNMAVAMLDIDHFKQVNDNYGHPVGDQVIRSLSWLLKQRLRKHDILCRYGGEEFLIGLPHTDADQAYLIIDRIRQDFAEIRHPNRDSYFCTSASGGIAAFPEIQSGDALIKAADDALYKAKRGGRNRIEHANPPASQGALFKI